MSHDHHVLYYASSNKDPCASRRHSPCPANQVLLVCKSHNSSLSDHLNGFSRKFEADRITSKEKKGRELASDPSDWRSGRSAAERSR